MGKRKNRETKKKNVESGSSTFASLGGLPVFDCSLDLLWGQLPNNLALLLHVLMFSNTWLPELGRFCVNTLSFYRFHSHRV